MIAIKNFEIERKNDKLNFLDSRESSKKFWPVNNAEWKICGLQGMIVLANGIRTNLKNARKRQ